MWQFLVDACRNRKLTVFHVAMLLRLGWQLTIHDLDSYVDSRVNTLLACLEFGFWLFEQIGILQCGCRGELQV